MKRDTEGGAAEFDLVRDALTKLDDYRIADIATEAVRQKTLDSRYLEVLSCAFGFARLAVAIGMDHTVFNDLIKVSGQLLISKCRVVNDVVAFLRQILDRYASTRDRGRLADRAADILTAGITTLDRRSRECLHALTWHISQLTRDQREALVAAAANLQSEFQKLPPGDPKRREFDRLLRSVERYNNILTRADRARTRRNSGAEWTIRNPGSVVSVHSVKGGVGKSVFSLALAMKLARRGKKVCLVDCDDEGPCQHFYVRVNASQSGGAVFFSEWLCSDYNRYPLDRLVQIELDGKRMNKNDRAAIQDNLRLLPGSIYPADLDLLDSFQRGKRPNAGIYPLVSRRIELLVEQLIDEAKFDHVILDTGPGLMHLSYDILMANVGLGGIPVFVMRPRPTDILAFCLDFDWLARRGPGTGASGCYVDKAFVLMTHAAPMREAKTAGTDNAMPEDWGVLGRIFASWPQFEAYRARFEDDHPEEGVARLLRSSQTNLTGHWVMPEVQSLRHAADTAFLDSHGPRVAETIWKAERMMDLVEKIFRSINSNQQSPQSLRRAGGGL